MSLARNIRYLRKKKEWSQDYVADKLGYKSYTTIQKWEMGISEPPLKKLKEIAELFKVDMNDLANADLEAPPKLEPVDIGKTVQIPVYVKIPAGVPMEAIEDIEDYIDVPVSMRPNELIALKVVGSSMYPKYLDGDYVIIRKQSDCESGQDCAIRVNGCDATLKKIIKEKDGIVLQPVNPEYEPKKYSYNDDLNPVVIIGIVVELRRKI